VKVPPPPEEPTLSPTIATKTTTRLYGANPFEEAVSITQHIWPAAVPLNNPSENDNDPDRPWGLTLITPDDPLTAITATPLIHFPDDAPVLYVTNSGIPAVTSTRSSGSGTPASRGTTTLTPSLSARPLTRASRTSSRRLA
jgi:hypothetical protein